MAGNSGSGRRPGFKHSEETKRKMSEAHLKGVHTSETKKKIGDAHRGKRLSEECRQQISRSKRLYDLDERCIRRLEDLKASYPTERSFFEEYETDLLFAMRDVRTDKELMDIRLYIETSSLRPEEPYQQFCGSYSATEEAIITLLDFKFFLERSMLNAQSF